MNLRELMQKAWRDNVWSKVISNGITWAIVAAIGAVGVLAAWFWSNLRPLAKTSGDWLRSDVVVPGWLLLAVGVLCASLFALYIFGAGKQSRATEKAADEPNALPVALRNPIVPPVGRPFAELSAEQQQFLIGQFRRGSRLFRFPDQMSALRWFEELKLWKYVVAQPMILAQGGDTTPHEIPERAWQELERLDRENRLVVTPQ